MIKGNKKEKYLSVDEILSRTNRGFDIFQHYLGKVKKLMKCPWRKDEKPSWGVFDNGTIWCFKDFSTEEVGNAMTFIERYFGLTHHEAKDKICWDFGLRQVGEKINTSPVKITWDTPEEDKQYIPINFSTCPFDEKHAKYWNDYHLSEEYIKKYNIFRVKDLAINKKRVVLEKDELTFAYYNKFSDTVKIMRIGVSPDKKWRTNATGDTLWLQEYMENCNNMIISKSVKDSLCLTLFGLSTVAVQSEAISCIEKNEDWLNTLICPIYIAFGTDKQGKEQSNKITAKYGYRHYNVPDKLLIDSINDVAEWCKADIMALEKHLREKNLI